MSLNGDYSKYTSLQREKIINYSVVINDKKQAEITINTYNQNTYKVIYKCMDHLSYRLNDIDGYIDLSFYYIKNFNVTNSRLSLFSLNCCFIEKGFSLSDNNIKGTRFEIIDCIIGDGKCSLHDNTYDCDMVGYYGVNFKDSIGFLNESYNIKGSMLFRGTSFGNGTTSFTRVSINAKEIQFPSNFGNGYISFLESDFCGDVYFYKTDFGDWNKRNDYDMQKIDDANIIFEKVRFEKGKVEFDMSNSKEGYIRFGTISFDCKLFKMIDAEFTRVEFQDSTISCNMLLQFNRISILEVKDCFIEKNLVINSKPEQMSFLGTINSGAIHMPWNRKYVYLTLKNYENEVTQGLTLEEFMKKGELFESKQVKHNRNQMMSQLVMLKENYNNLGQYSDEDKAYRMFMKHKTNKWYMTPMKIFGVFGGYGTQPWLIMLFMIAFWVLFGALYYFKLSSQFSSIINDISAINTFKDALYYSGITFLTIGYGDISPAVNGDALRFWSIAEGFLGLFSMSYFTVAVVRKLLR